METFKRAVFEGPGQVRIHEVPIPTPGPRQGLIRVRACALCTLEQRLYSGDLRFYPMTGGHEVAGELVEIGDEVYHNGHIGDRVVASLLTRCGYCDSCRRGRDNICDNSREAFGRDMGGPPGLAEYVLVEDYQIFGADDAIPFEELCLAEPLACAVRSVRIAEIERGDDVVVIGAGIMGLLHVLLASQAGARVIVSELDDQRAAFARGLGAGEVVDLGNGSFAEEVKGLTGSKGADVIFCAVSVGSAVEEALEAAAKGGRVHVFASIHPHGTRISVDPNVLHGREVTLTGTMSQNREDMRQAVGLISRGTVDMKPFVSRVVPFERLEEGLELAMGLDTYRVIISL